MKKRFLLFLPLLLGRAGGGLLLGLLWLLPGCRKDEPRKTILHGRVTEYGTGKAVADARIYVGCEESVPFGPSSFTLVDSLITDADGKFYKEYAEADLCGNSSLIPYKKGYFKGTPLYPTTDNKAFEVVLDPESWLKVVTVPDVTGSLIYFTGTFTGAAGWETRKSDGTKEWIFLTGGNREHWIDWDYWGGGVNSHKETISLPAFDTTLYTIHY